jgi:hypothetical protein
LNRAAAAVKVAMLAPLANGADPRRVTGFAIA